MALRHCRSHLGADPDPQVGAVFELDGMNQFFTGVFIIQMSIADRKGEVEFGTGAADLAIGPKNRASTLDTGGRADNWEIIFTLMAQKSVGYKKNLTADGAGSIFQEEVVFEEGQEGLFQVHGYLFSGDFTPSGG
jgi:hypothetical protein